MKRHGQMAEVPELFGFCHAHQRAILDLPEAIGFEIDNVLVVECLASLISEFSGLRFNIGLLVFDKHVLGFTRCQTVEDVLRD